VIVTKGYKQEEFERLLAINDACYIGVERPTPAEFQGMLAGDVFVARVNEKDFSHSFPDLPDEGFPIGFAIVQTDCINPYLWSLAVDPAYRGRGIGGNLLIEVIEYFTPRATEITLHVKPDNPAQKLYFDHGFRVQSVIRDWYGKEGNALYMWQALS